MNIGQASNESGVSAKMIRYYEQIGLIPKADRTESGYRDYSDIDVHMLRFIRRSRDMGFSVAEITELLGLWRDDSRKSSEVRELARGHIAELQKRIANLQEMANTLQALVNACKGDHRPHCPILAELENDGPATIEPASPRRGAVGNRLQ
ncbi:Cu(I)-responsive transcriptional regulator [Brucella intermedia]|uniref:MerR family transcriptional regulator n=1 Tax=Brucella intermedia M86 TaxID=1234597 RepID=M5JSV1_9HYPH|nr:Cu(I)-responsive transcriptional regulator [Brucella intermedia]ELT51227.1 MerR family transcriptional regulator [Brucella intermedia M86]